MSLARTLMNGGMYGSSIDPSKYAHDTGALRISMESTEELYEIFKEGFYEVEQAELGAIHEGVALESSQWAYVAESAIGSAIDKVKAFLKKLWEKVKAFFHSVRRYFDSIIMSAKEFAKKYKDDITEASKNLNDFKYKMFKYTNIENAKMTGSSTEEITKAAEKILNMTGGITYASNGTPDTSNKYMDADELKSIGGQSKDTDYENKKYDGDDSKNTKFKEYIEYLKDCAEGDKVASRCAAEHSISGAAGIDASDFDDAVFSHFRDGASGKDDTEEISVSELTSYMNVLINSKALDNVNKMQEQSNTKFKKALDICDKASSKLSTAKNTGKYEDNSKGAMLSEMVRAMSSAIARYQDFENKYLKAYKDAVEERDKTYKSLIMAGIKNSSKKRK